MDSIGYPPRRHAPRDDNSSKSRAEQRSAFRYSPGWGMLPCDRIIAAIGFRLVARIDALRRAA
jgi:hypothetical protein